MEGIDVREVRVTAGLDAAIESFCGRVNNHPRIVSILEGWDVGIEVLPTDGDEAYRMRSADSRLRVTHESADGEADIVLRAERETLRRVFVGEENPAMLFLHGTLQVFADESDQVKLDAIALLLWD